MAAVYGDLFFAGTGRMFTELIIRYILIITSEDVKKMELFRKKVFDIDQNLYLFPL